MKARKKPVIVEVMKFDAKNDPYDVAEWCSGKVLEIGIYLESLLIKVPSLEGDVIASFGDYIIKGINGEFYPRKPDIFEKTYDIIDNDADEFQGLSLEGMNLNEALRRGLSL